MGTPRKWWSRDAVASRILAGDYLIVYRDHLLKIPSSWLDAHPGGSLALLHFIGRDATDEIEAYHLNDTLNLISRYSIGRVEHSDAGWMPFVPPIMSGWVRRLDPARKSLEWFREADIFKPATGSDTHPSPQILLVKHNDMDDLSRYVAPDRATLEPRHSSLSLRIQTQHSTAYKQLHQRITIAGLYKTPYFTGYGPEVVRYILLGFLSAYCYKHNWQIVSAVFLGLMWHQLVFTVHDLGHMGVTHNWTIDRLIAILIADFVGGLSVGWWVENHNIHHLVTNHPIHDPDIEHLPFFAISPVFFSSLWSSYYKRTMIFDKLASWLIPIQHKLFYVVMAFARFNLYFLSYSFLLAKVLTTKRARGGRWVWWLEVAGLLFFWSWFGAVLYGCGSWKKALVYLLVSHIVTSPLHVQIVLSHFSMSTADLGPLESFPHRQLRTTTDVICPESIAFIHGGLDLQVAHHLFPRLPRHNLRKASKLVKEFAQEQGLVYAEFGFIDGNSEVIGVLRSVANQVSLVGKVASVEARGAIEKKLEKRSKQQ